MKKEVITELWNNYSDKITRLDPFASYKMGLLQAQSALKIDAFDVICAPYRISMKKAELFVVLSKEELPFFKHYTTKVASLKLAFQPPNVKAPLKFVVWVSIDKLSMVKGKENMVMVDVSYKSCPDALIELIGTFFMEQKQLDYYYNELADRQVMINNETSRELRFNNYVECQIGARKIEAKLLSLGVNMCIMLLPGLDPNPVPGAELFTKFYFQRYRFSAKGKVGKITKRNDGFLSVSYVYGPIPELVDILSEYFIKRNLIKKPALEA
jgi:hypothetical protein